MIFSANNNAKTDSIAHYSCMPIYSEWIKIKRLHSECCITGHADAANLQFTVISHMALKPEQHFLKAKSFE